MTEPVELVEPKRSRKQRARGMGTIYDMPGSRYKWIAFSVNGKRIQKSSGKTTRSEAAEVLKQEQLRAASGYDATAANLRVRDLFPLSVRDWTQRGKSRPSLQWQGYVWNNHLLPFFGDLKADSVGTRAIQSYIESRTADLDRSDSLAVLKRNGTINRELAVLSSAFTMAYEAQPRLVPQTLHFKRLAESAPRTGFIEEAEYQRLMKAIPQSWLKAMLCVGFRTGMRVGEVLALNAGDVDLDSGVIRIRHSKNGKPRTIPIMFDMRQWLALTVAGKRPNQPVFSRENGDRIANFRTEWDAAVSAAGLSITFHDLRRSAVRAMSRAGLDQVEAMKISGHKTDSMYRRYNIVNEARLKDAAAKLEAFADAERKRAARVALESASKTESTIEPKSLN